MDLNEVVIKRIDGVVTQTKFGVDTEGWGQSLPAGIYFERNKNSDGDTSTGIELEYVAHNGDKTLWRAK